MKGLKKMKLLLSRLIDWLKRKGFTPEEILDCISYILGK